MSEELKPCPFCGGAAEYAYNVSQDNYSMAECQSCGARAFWKKWNTRAETPQSIPSEREEMLNEIVGHLGAAAGQTISTDDQIIAEHVRAAHGLALALRRASVASEHLTRQALEQGSAKGSRATASRQPAGGPSDPSQQVVSAKGAHQAQGRDL